MALYRVELHDLTDDVRKTHIVESSTGPAAICCYFIYKWIQNTYELNEADTLAIYSQLDLNYLTNTSDSGALGSIHVETKRELIEVYIYKQDVIKL